MDRLKGFLMVPLLVVAVFLAYASGAWAGATVKTDKSVYTPGDRMVIMVKDSDANADSNATESIDVTVSTSSGEEITYTLLESGDATGVFFSLNATAAGSPDATNFDSSWYVNCDNATCADEGAGLNSALTGIKLVASDACVSVGGTAGSSNAILCVKPGDTITVTYGSTSVTATVAYHTGSLEIRPATIMPSDNAPLSLVLADPDLNKNPLAKECINGTVGNHILLVSKDKTAQEVESIYPTLCETGKNSGVFVASGYANETGGVAGNGTTTPFAIKVPGVGGKICALYDDQLNEGGVVQNDIKTCASYGVAGVSGSLSLSADKADIADKVEVTLTDANLNQKGAQADSTWGSGNNGYDCNGTMCFTWDGQPVKNATLLVKLENATCEGVFKVVTDDQGNISSSSIEDYWANDTSCNWNDSGDEDNFTVISDGQPGFVEASPDGEHWVALNLQETAVDSGEFKGKVSFTYDVCEGTVNATGSGDYYTEIDLSSCNFGSSSNASVVRVFTCDRIYEEFATVYNGTLGNGATIYVEKLDLENSFKGKTVYVQIIGKDGDNKLGAFFGANYQVRYIDQYDDTNNQATVEGGSVALNTYTASVSFEPAETAAVNQKLVITLTDPDLNTDATSVQSTNSTNGLTKDKYDTCYEFSPGKRAVIVSTAATWNAVKLGTNAVLVQLKETGVDTGIFDNRNAKITLGDTTSNNPSDPKLKVADGDKIYVYYFDTPSADEARPLGGVWSVFEGPVVQTSIGTLETNVDEAFACRDSEASKSDCVGQTIVVTLNDADANSNPASVDSENVTVVSSSDSAGITVELKETGPNTGVFKGHFDVTRGSSNDTAYRIKAIAGDTVQIRYEDQSTNPATVVTKNIQVKNFDASIAFATDVVSLGSKVKITVTDPEANEHYNAKDTITVTVFSDSDPVGVTMTLVETDKDTGVFEKEVLVSEDDSIPNARVKAAVGDTLTARYIEHVDANGQQATRTATATVGEPAPAPSNAAPETALEAKGLADWPFDPAATITVSADQKRALTLVVTMNVPADRQGQTATLYYYITTSDGTPVTPEVVSLGETTLGETVEFAILPDAVDLSGVSGTFYIYVGFASQDDLSDLLFNYYAVTLE